MPNSATSQRTVDVDPAALFADPYPTYERLRREAPVAYAPAMDRYLVSRYQDIVTVSRDWETFSAEEDVPAPENAVVGETLMARDGDEHLRLRQMMAAPLKQGSIREHWQPVFQANTDALLAELAGRAVCAEARRAAHMPRRDLCESMTLIPASELAHDWRRHREPERQQPEQEYRLMQPWR